MKYFKKQLKNQKTYKIKKKKKRVDF